MEQPQWGPELVRVIAGQIRWHRERKRPKMSAQALADRCAEIGWPIKRSVLSNLESGYRETITVPELIVIAAALEVPLADLLLPLGRAEQVEILPGTRVPPVVALYWVNARRPLPGAKWEYSAAPLFYEWITSWKALMDAEREERECRQRGDEEKAQIAGGYAAMSRRALARLAETMRAQGMEPPKEPVRTP